MAAGEPWESLIDDKQLLLFLTVPAVYEFARGGRARIVATVIVVSAVLNDRFGSEAVLVSAALAGLVSTGSAAVALASLVVAGQLPASEAVVPLAAAISVNAGVRIVLALRGGATAFGWAVATGLLLTAAAVWAGWWFAAAIRIMMAA